MKKKFDAVEYQRKVRAKLSRKYQADRESFVRDLKNRYGHLQRQKTHLTV